MIYLQGEECGCCRGHGEVLIVRPTAGPTQIEPCSNCRGTGTIIAAGTFNITLRRSDELPPFRLKNPPKDQP